MPKILTAEAIEQYRRDGYYSPLAALTAAEVSHSRNALESFEKSHGHSLQGAQRSKSHLLFKWVDDVMREEQILDAIEDLIGPSFKSIEASINLDPFSKLSPERRRELTGRQLAINLDKWEFVFQ